MTLRQKTSTILRLLLPVLLVSAAVAWSDPVKAATELPIPSVGQSCIVGSELVRDGNGDFIRPGNGVITAFELKCTLNPSVGTPLASNIAAVCSLASTPVNSSGSQFTQPPGHNYGFQWSMTSDPVTDGITLVSSGDMSDGLGSGCTGTDPALPDNFYQLRMDFRWQSGSAGAPADDFYIVNVNGGFLSGAAFQGDWVPNFDAIDGAGSAAWDAAWPDYWTGQAPPPDAAECVDFVFDFEVWPVGPTPGYVPITTPASWVIFEGDEVRTNVDLSGAPVVQDQFEFYSRWSAGDLMSLSSLTVAGPSTFPQSFERLRSGEAVPFAGFEVGCVKNGDVQNITTYTTAGGWGTAGDFADAPCSSLDYSLEVDQGGGWVSLGPVDPVFTGDDFRVTVDNIGSWAVGQLDVAYRTSEVSAFEYLGTMAQGVTVFPVTFTVLDLDERPSFTGSEVEIECSGVGSPSSYWSMGGGFSSFPDDSSETSDGEGCYKLSGLSLTRPTTWVSGAGRMGVCLVDYMVIPDGERVDALLSDASADLEGQFPFSAGYLLLDFGQTAVDSIDTAAQCIDLDMDVGSYETPCLATDAVSAGSWRPTLVVIVIGLLLLSVIGLSFELIRK